MVGVEWFVIIDGGVDGGVVVSRDFVLYPFVVELGVIADFFGECSVCGACFCDGDDVVVLYDLCVYFGD